MAERLPSRTEIRMSIGFMNNTATTYTPSSPEAVFDHATAVAEERSAEGRRQPCPQQRRSTSGVNAVHLLPGPYGNASAFAANELAPRPSTSRARGTRQVNEEHRHGHTFGTSWPAATDTPAARGAAAAGAWAGQDGFHSPPGSRFVGDNTPANNWVRFAWEPLPGGTKYGATAVVFPPEPAAAGDGNSDGSNAGGTTGTTMLRPLDELWEGPADRNSDESSVGVKRFRPEAGQNNIIGGRRYEGGEKRMGWTTTPSGSSRRRCLPGLEQFAVAGATRQTARTPQPSLHARPWTSRTFAEAAERTGTEHCPPSAADERTRRGCGPGGSNTRSSSWGGDVAMDPTRQAEVMVSQQVQWASGGTEATNYRHQHQQQQQEEQEQQGYVQGRYSSDSHETGRSAKKPRHHRLRVQRVLSAGHMDSLADGVSSLGVASPDAAAAGSGSSSGGWNQADAPRTPHGCTWRRDSFGGQTDGSPQTLCPVSALGKGNPGGGVVRAGVGACTGHIRTTRSRGVPPGAGVGGFEHLRSRKRRNGSISAGASFSRTARTPSVLPTEETLAGMDTASLSWAAAPFTRRLRRIGVGHATVTVTGAATTAAGQKRAATCGVERTTRDLGVASPSPLGLPRTSSTLARLIQQGGGKEAPGFDAAVRASAASSDGNAGVEVAAVAGAIDVGDDDKSSSSDGGAAHEDLSAWLHSTHDWWTSD
ncbi:unnamed protein product [Ectocarpus sp. 12 AP-2014]